MATGGIRTGPTGAGGFADDSLGVLYSGGTVRTMNPDRPLAEAVATRGGRILAVGTEADCRSALGLAGGSPGSPGGRTVVDLAGLTMLPGFHDAHLHPLPMAFFEHHLDLTGFTRLGDVLDTLADRARAAQEGDWVLGLRLDEEKLDERRLPGLAELDAVGAGRPVVILRKDGHTALGNSASLAAAGIESSSLNPDGGEYVRDTSGALTGLCRENAAQVLMGAVPVPPLDELRAAARRVFSDLAAAGITTVGAILQTDAEGPAGAAGSLEWVAMQMFQDDLPMSMNAILGGADVARIATARDGPLHKPAEGRRVSGLKIFLDGTLGARTAYMHRPYADDPATAGMLTIARDECVRRMEAAHTAGLQVCLHAIGDAANDLALDLFAELLAKHPPARGKGAGHGHRIEHASVLTPGAIERFAELGVIAAVQPLFLRSEHDWLGARLGPERMQLVYPFRSLLDAGATLAGASDAPIEDPDVLAGIHAAVTRHGVEPAEAITSEEALAMYTTGAAAASGQRAESGSISEGKAADLVVLSGDPVSVSADEIPGLCVELAVSRGRVIHAR